MHLKAVVVLLVCLLDLLAVWTGQRDRIIPIETCTPDNEGHGFCRLICELERYRNGYCEQIDNYEYLCVCVD